MPALHVNAKALKEFKERIHLFLIRVFMNPVNKRNVQVVVVLGHRFVGGQHKRFHHPFTGPPFPELNLHRMPLIVQNYLGFVIIKFDGAPLMPHP